MGGPYTRKKIVLSQTNVAATDVTLSFMNDSAAGALIDFLSLKKLPSSGSRFTHCEVRSGTTAMASLLPIEGLNLGGDRIITLVPSRTITVGATNGEEDESEGGIGVIGSRANVDQFFRLSGGDKIVIISKALEQNESLVVFLRARDAPVVITNESGAGVTMTVTDE